MYFIANGFIYRKSNSIIHKLDPRVKLLISIQLFTLALLVSDLYNLLIMFEFGFEYDCIFIEFILLIC